MKSISLFKYYKRATVLPFIGTIIGGIILVMLHDDKELQSGMLSGDNYGDTIFMIIIFSLSICVLCSTIFLSKYKQVTGNFFLHLLSWMALPVSLTSFMLYNQVHFLIEYLTDGWEHPPYETELQILFVFVCIGHLLGIFISFMQFRNQMKKKPVTPVQEKPRTHTPSVQAHQTPVTPHR